MSNNLKDVSAERTWVEDQKHIKELEAELIQFHKLKDFMGELGFKIFFEALDKSIAEKKLDYPSHKNEGE